MEAFHTHTGIGVPLRRSNVDTDQIIPAVFLKRVTRTGFEDGLFASWRSDPSFVLNLSPFDRGSLLVAGPDFGTGSSREHAVWALMDYGFEVVISPRFGDIFRNNSTKNGLVPVVLDADVVERIHAALDDDPDLEVVVDVERLVVEVPSLGMAEPFPLAPALWAATAPPAPPTPPLETSARADVCVIGAGYAGLSTALALAERGIQTIVLEAREPGWGGSGRNGGQVIPDSSTIPPSLKPCSVPSAGRASSTSPC